MLPKSERRILASRSSRFALASPIQGVKTPYSGIPRGSFWSSNRLTLHTAHVTLIAPSIFSLNAVDSFFPFPAQYRDFPVHSFLHSSPTASSLSGYEHIALETSVSLQASRPHFPPIPQIGVCTSRDLHLDSLPEYSVFSYIVRSYWLAVETFGRSISFVDRRPLRPFNAVPYSGTRSAIRYSISSPTAYPITC